MHIRISGIYTQYIHIYIYENVYIGRMGSGLFSKTRYSALIILQKLLPHARYTLFTFFFSIFYDPHNRWFIVRPLFDLDRTEWFACVFPCRYTHRVFRSGDERSTSILLGFLVECNSEAKIYFAHRHTYTYSLMHPGTGQTEKL